MSKPNYQAISFRAGEVFTPGAPINARELFSGRLGQVQTILNTISQRGYHAVLYGERGVGKTSLSNVLSEFLAETGSEFLLPRVNCDASDSYSSLWRKQFRDILITEQKQTIGFARDKVEEARSIVDRLSEPITPDDVRRTLAELARSAILVPIFDEFDRIRDRHIATMIADTIKSLSDYSVSATLLIIGVADSVDDLIAEHQSIERALVQVPMPRMSRREIIDIILNGLQHLQMSGTAEALEEISSLSQGLPYIAHLLSLNSTRAALSATRLEIQSSDVEVGIKQSLDQWQQSIKSSYYNATKSQQPGHLYREVVLACALARHDELGYFSAADVREPLNVITGRNYDIPNFARHLKELSESGRGDMLSRTGETRRLRYRFNSPLMRPYIVMRGFSEALINKRDMQRLTAFTFSS